jgi:UDP-N-acetyl-D-mannosaminuronic acid transferase (WecB/TagA/CpsF family)
LEKGEIVMKNIKQMFTEGTFTLEEQTADSTIKFNVNNQIEEMFSKAELVITDSLGNKRIYKISDLNVEQWEAFDVEGIKIDEEVTQDELVELELI